MGHAVVRNSVGERKSVKGSQHFPAELRDVRVVAEANSHHVAPSVASSVPLCRVAASKPGRGIRRLLGIAEEPAPPSRRGRASPGRFRQRRGAAPGGNPCGRGPPPRGRRRRSARPPGHVTCLTDYVQSGARDGKSLATDKGWGHNKEPSRQHETSRSRRLAPRRCRAPQMRKDISEATSRCTCHLCSRARQVYGIG